jgi:serine/threonine protein kinase/Tol biopolymer transport system component
MGEVYLASDSTLDRQVAIKVLHETMTRDQERVARFEREAKLLASLNHPNIASIHGFDDSDGTRFLVMEYVEGETLSGHLNNSPVPVEDALDIAKQIAEALEAAHEQGVIHRDLKPANVMIREDGTVKVLDFGLAKAMTGEPSGGADANSPTITANYTRPGVVLGTAAYMSPEQARGRALDKRTDIWSFGIMLFECLTGHRLFQGETANDSMGAIMHKDPEWSLLPSGTPPTIQLLLRRCLTKDRKRRLQAIGDARVELEAAIVDPSCTSLGLATAAIAEAAMKRRSSRLFAAFALVAGVAVAATWFATASLRLPPSNQTMHLVIPSQTKAYKYAYGMLVSPDGTKVAFAAERKSGTGAGPERLLWVRRLDEFDARELGTETSGDLFWSHDSRYIAFHDDGKLWSIRDDGADKRLLASHSANEGGTWNSDGTIIVSDDGGGLRVLRPGAASLEPLPGVSAETFKQGGRHPHFLPGGNRFLFWAEERVSDLEMARGALFAGNLATGKQTRIGGFPSEPWYVEPGTLVYVENGTVKAAPFDADRLVISGKPIVLAQDADFFKPTGQTELSASLNGVVVFTPSTALRRLVWFDAKGNRLGQVGAEAKYQSRIRISPDGQSVATSVADPRTGLSDIVLLSLERNTSRRLTVDPRWESFPVWSRDSQTIYYSNDHHGKPDVYSLAINGTGVPREVFSKSGSWFASDVSSDGRFLVVDVVATMAGNDISVVPLDAKDEPFAFIRMRGRQANARFSPDMKRIAYESSETGAKEIFVETFPDPSGGVQVSIHGGSSPVWSPDGHKLYFGQSQSGDRDWAIMVVEFSDSDPPSPLPPQVVFKPGSFASFDVAPDGERFLLRMVPDTTPDSHVILNWNTEFGDQE